MEETSAALIAAGKQLIDFENIHRSPNIDLIHCAREAAFASKAAGKLAAVTKVDSVRDVASAAANAAKQTEFLARKLACRIGLPVQTATPFLPTLASRGFSEGHVAAMAVMKRRAIDEFI